MQVQMYSNFKNSIMHSYKNYRCMRYNIEVMDNDLLIELLIICKFTLWKTLMIGSCIEIFM